MNWYGGFWLRYLWFKISFIIWVISKLNSFREFSSIFQILHHFDKLLRNQLKIRPNTCFDFWINCSVLKINLKGANSRESLLLPFGIYKSRFRFAWCLIIDFFKFSLFRRNSIFKYLNSRNCIQNLLLDSKWDKLTLKKVPFVLWRFMISAPLMLFTVNAEMNFAYQYSI